MKNEKTKATVLIALGLIGIALAYAAAILSTTSNPSAQQTLLPCVTFGIGGGCLLLLWGASRWARADEAERQQAERPRRKEVAA